ncbi:MAG: adenine deaminase [Deltaproteobacteria bacterium]|nr:adenine deaminase [Deltaproteobacteria bacterium]NIS77589.1 adenine deaminase [Deltaproteobacteria bacterium]
MVRKKPDIATLVETARGDREADLVIENGTVVDVFRRKLCKSSVAVKDGYIVGLGDYRAREVIDAAGMYVAPGLIDGHTHIESTFLSPQEFGRLCLTSGVTCVVADPHEIANVFGLPGVLWMIDMARQSPVRIYYSCPSCVPSSPLESPGGKIGLKDMAILRGYSEVIALGEVMDYQGLTLGKRDLIEKVRLFQGLPLEGHAPGLRGKALSAYRVTGVSSDHETEDPEEAEEKLSKGFHVMVREGSIAQNLKALYPFIEEYQGNSRISIVSDDLNVLDMADGNYLGRVLAQGARMGIDPINLLCMVTLNTAMRFNLTSLGAVAPGYRADLVIYEDLFEFVPHRVLVGGRVRYLSGEPVAEADAPSIMGTGRTVHLPPAFSPETFRVKKRKKSVKAIEVIPGQLKNEIVTLPGDVFQGRYASSVLAWDLVKVCVIERHGGTGRIGKGFVRGLNLRAGAIALTFAHDAHNLVVAGASDDEMFAAAGLVARMGGGIAALSGRGESARLPLKVGGIVSTARYERVVSETKRVKGVCEQISPLGIDLVNILSFIALPVIPEGRITDKGFIDVRAFRKVPIWA